MRVWGRSNSVNVQKVMWAAHEVGLEPERIDVGGAFGGLDTDAYGALNPNRKIPVLEDGETVVWESNACVRYLAARYGAGGLWPEDPAARALADQWMDWQVSTPLADMTVVFWQLIRTPKADRDPGAIEASAARLGTIWSILDRHLASHPYVAGPSLTMGDIPVGALAYRWLNLPIERPELAHLGAWYQRLTERPAFRAHVMLPVT